MGLYRLSKMYYFEFFVALLHSLAIIFTVFAITFTVFAIIFATFANIFTVFVISI